MAALYARVSTDRQREEATSESQLFELKRQIATAGHALVKEYIDDGYSGAYLDRPALEELRGVLKTDTFDAVYFLCADRNPELLEDQPISFEEAQGDAEPRSLRMRRENIAETIALLENLRAPKASALDTTEREVA